MNITNVAVIGLGNIAKRHRKNLKILFPNACIYAISASGRVVLEVIEDADYVLAGMKELLAIKLDFAIVASPATYHAKYASELIKSNIPVLIEKPVTADISDSDLLLNLTKLHGTAVAVGYCLRYLPSMIKMKQLLTSQTIGSIYNCSINIGQFLPDWRPSINYFHSVSASKCLGGGALLELSHELDYAQWLLGDLNVEFAYLRTSLELGLEVEELADLVLTNQKGTFCNIHLDFLQKLPQRNCSFIGSEGRLDWDLLENSIYLHTKKGSKLIYSEPMWDKNKMYLNMIKDFVSLIKQQKNFCISLAQATKTVHLIEEIKDRAVWGCAQ